MFRDKDPFDQAVMGTITVLGGALVILAAWHAVNEPAPQTAGQAESAMVESAPEEDTAEAAQEEAPAEETAGATEEEATEEETAEAAEEEATEEETAEAAEEEATEEETAEAAEEEATEEETAEAAEEHATEEETAEAAEEDATEEETAEATEEEASEEETAEAAEEAIEPEATGDAAEESASDSETADASEEEATEEDTADAASDEGWSSEQMAYLDGDAEAGARVWNQCRACHVADTEQNRVGPHLVGVIGRDIASIEGFRYSSALQELQGQQWTPEQLDAWLENPRDYARGTSMSYPGLRNEGDRRDLLAYLYDMQN